LTITGLLRTGYTYSAQVAVVNEHLVAKIYDPVYDSGFDCYDNKRDVVVLADGDYTREAAAYEELAHSHSAAVREVTPEYHGSWTIEVATTIGSKTYTRSVRLLLMQYIQGTVMSSIQALLLPKQTRSNMLRQVLKAETLLYGAGVHHRDIAPRNIIILSPPPFTTPHLQFKIIDFNVSNVLRFSKSYPDEPPQSDEVKDKWPGRILGPITRFWDGLQEFEVRD
jgi:serine/threonine protein kinase